MVGLSGVSGPIEAKEEATELTDSFVTEKTEYVELVSVLFPLSGFGIGGGQAGVIGRSVELELADEILPTLVPLFLFPK